MRAVWPPVEATEAALWPAVEAAMDREAGFLDRVLDSPPQTNEVRRSAALIAAGHWLAAAFGMPMVLSELGASAGSNTIWDRFALALPGLTLGPADPALTLSPNWTGPLPRPRRPGWTGAPRST